jgi:hypothetical protein
MGVLRRDAYSPETIDGRVGRCYRADKEFFDSIESPVNLNGGAAAASERVKEIRREYRYIRAANKNGMRKAVLYMYGVSVVAGISLGAYLLDTPQEQCDKTYVGLMAVVAVIALAAGVYTSARQHLARRHEKMLCRNLKGHRKTMDEILSAANAEKHCQN